MRRTRIDAQVAELVFASDLKSDVHYGHAGSNPVLGTMIEAIAELCKTYLGVDTRRYVRIVDYLSVDADIVIHNVDMSPSFGVQGEKSPCLVITLKCDRLAFTRYDKIGEHVTYDNSWSDREVAVVSVGVVRLSNPDMFNKLKYFVQHGKMM